ncbi:unnamed protein product [Acanthoscelides obtectus]|uniref:Uncharacterized protein n=1 Tax=Acanthoscelides obtectus TaxID=200917 RepID=A0A9P0L273_ACAOB|nr:unnamed protein product [Acanthoscelides obtectus]CAK1650215.1 hypothetical protein AOBTE_LOCUS16691 [Acanthoscelides obtectus]
MTRTSKMLEESFGRMVLTQ